MEGINAGGESDRVVVSWDLISQNAISGSEPRLKVPDVDEFVRSGATVVLDVDRLGDPLIREGDGDVLLCHIPADIVQLREHDVNSAMSWRHALRKTLGAAIHNGHVVTGMTRDGWYLLHQRVATRA